MNQVAPQDRGISVDSNCFMDGTLDELTFSPSEQTQLAVRIKASVPHPLAQKEITTRHEVAGHSCVVADRTPDTVSEFHRHFLVRIDREHPLARGLRNSRVLLCCITAPAFLKDRRLMLPGDIDGAIS